MKQLIRNAILWVNGANLSFGLREAIFVSLLGIVIASLAAYYYS